MAHPLTLKDILKRTNSELTVCYSGIQVTVEINTHILYKGRPQDYQQETNRSAQLRNFQRKQQRAVLNNSKHYPGSV